MQITFRNMEFDELLGDVEVMSAFGAVANELFPQVSQVTLKFWMLSFSCILQ